MPLPARSILALGVLAVLAGLIAWIVVVQLVRSPPRSAMGRAGLVGAVVLLATVALWIVFVLPAYWD